MVFQQFNLFAHMRVLDNVTLGPVKVRGQSKQQAERRAREVLARVGVEDLEVAIALPHAPEFEYRLALRHGIALWIRVC